MAALPLGTTRGAAHAALQESNLLLCLLQLLREVVPFFPLLIQSTPESGLFLLHFGILLFELGNIIIQLHSGFFQSSCVTVKLWFKA